MPFKKTRDAVTEAAASVKTTSDRFSYYIDLAFVIALSLAALAFMASLYRLGNR